MLTKFFKKFIYIYSLIISFCIIFFVRLFDLPTYLFRKFIQFDSVNYFSRRSNVHYEVIKKLTKIKYKGIRYVSVSKLEEQRIIDRFKLENQLRSYIEEVLSVTGNSRGGGYFGILGLVSGTFQSMLLRK